MCIKYVTEGTDLLEISLMRRYLHFDLTLLVHLVTQTWLKASVGGYGTRITGNGHWLCPFVFLATRIEFTRDVLKKNIGFYPTNEK